MHARTLLDVAEWLYKKKRREEKEKKKKRKSALNVQCYDLEHAFIWLSDGEKTKTNEKDLSRLFLARPGLRPSLSIRQNVTLGGNKVKT